jgi:protein-S-isoprenylcysteine O-methyltransferase Ste14
MSRFLGFLYGLAAYLVFFGTILYAIGFVEGLVVPKTIDSGPVVSMTEALVVNLLLMSLFAVQHSVGLSHFGWVLVFLSTFLINHFELFGLHQVANNLTGRDMPEVQFKTPVLYKLVRHPIYLGFIIAFWMAPVMTTGHLLFAAVTTAYIFVGIFLEERDLVELFGDNYRNYRARVAMLVPFWPKSS